ncbi:unnamed protein product, partial [Pleuronectes platessa]
QAKRRERLSSIWETVPPRIVNSPVIEGSDARPLLGKQEIQGTMPGGMTSKVVVGAGPDPQLPLGKTQGQTSTHIHTYGQFNLTPICLSLDRGRKLDKTHMETPHDKTIPGFKPVREQC